MTRTKRGERTNAEILEAARAHLLEVGLDAFSLREVARRAELSPSALYNHFESKDALVNELAMEAVGLLGGYLERVPRELSAHDRLLALGESYLRFAAEQPERYRLVFDMLVSPAPQWEYFAGVAYPFSLIVEAVSEGLNNGELLDRSGIGASGVAYGVWALVHGFVMLSAHHLANIEDDLAPFQLAGLSAHLDGLSAHGRAANASA